jgi:hypothetical protein
MVDFCVMHGCMSCVVDYSMECMIGIVLVIEALCIRRIYEDSN